ncbi:tetrahydrofolate dehydrogenase/cyclohydrolase catalytic domain-containing protein [Nocardia sp. R6R-6]|uniref:tetrahydrofolate dehydrogenase/cyclohydrolase catalytic domain-containing protein n=1 Tax=Nocardia sp. R6R-6 TaxID=3459303 RepID=UPI00403DDB95
MNAIVIDGKTVAAMSRAHTAERADRVVRARGFAPGLATILVGDDPASEVYVRNKRYAAVQAGMADFHVHLPATSSGDEVARCIEELADDERVSGILLQLPLPAHLDRAALIERIPPEKDVDGLTTLNQGKLARGVNGLRPCTPTGVIRLLDHAGVTIEGAEAVVIGKSELVGHPTAELLLHRGATVTVAHILTRNLAAVTARADIVVVATGRRGLVGAEHIKPGAAVIDVGIHNTVAGLVGDVRFDEVARRAGWISPVPGGVGPMTIAMLLENTVTAAESALTRTFVGVTA